MVTQWFETFFGVALGDGLLIFIAVAIVANFWAWMMNRIMG